MKPKIHPKYYPNAKVICSCGNTWTTGATVPEIHTDVCSACHPFFTGEQRIVDTAGQVDRFMRRLEKKSKLQAETAASKKSSKK
jgi:large subunit ribosomal protein L31